jgi:hypothetical protein
VVPATLAAACLYSGQVLEAGSTGELGCLEPHVATKKISNARQTRCMIMYARLWECDFGRIVRESATLY